MLEAAAQREERQQRFEAAMTANLMHCWVRERITVDDLLGIPGKKTRARVPQQMGEQEREAYAARLAAAAQRKRGKSARRTAAQVRAEDEARDHGGRGAGSQPVAG